MNDILKLCNKDNRCDKIPPLGDYKKGKGKGKRHSPDIQKYWLPLHSANFQMIKDLIVQAPILHLPARSGQFYLQCNSSPNHIGSLLYQIQNGTKRIFAYYSATMPDAASRYSSSELELYGLKNSLLNFQYLLKYSTFTVLMDHNTLKCIYCSRNPPKTVRIQKFCKEISDFSFDFQHISGKHMFVSDFLSRFLSANENEELIPFLTKNSSLDTWSYMTKIDDLCQYDYVTHTHSQ